LLNYTDSPFIVGSITYSILTVTFDKVLVSNLNSLDVQTVVWLLSQLGQDSQIQSSRSRSQEASPWIQLIWIIIIALIIILIVFVGILISKSAYKNKSVSLSITI